jgi:hypothetical protein
MRRPFFVTAHASSTTRFVVNLSCSVDSIRGLCPAL